MMTRLIAGTMLLVTSCTHALEPFLAISVGSDTTYIRRSGEIVRTLKDVQAGCFSYSGKAIARTTTGMYLLGENFERCSAEYERIVGPIDGRASCLIAKRKSGDLPWTLLGVQDGIERGSFAQALPGAHDIYPVRIGTEWKFVDRSGSNIDPEVRDIRSLGPFSDGFAVVKQGNSWGVINMQLRVMKLGVQYRSVSSFTAGVAIASREDGRFDAIASNGNVLATYQADEMGPYSEGLVPVRVGELWGYADLSGMSIAPIQYRAAGPFCGGLASVSDGRGFKYVDRFMRTVIEGPFVSASCFIDGYALVRVVRGGVELERYISSWGDIIEPYLKSPSTAP